MRRLKKYALATFMTLGSLLRADVCELSNWYMSNGTNVKDWAGSVDAAKSDPKNWILETKWQFNREKQVIVKNRVAYAVATLTADEDYIQGLSIQGDPRIRLNGEELAPIEKGHHIYALHLKKGKNTLEVRVNPSKDRWSTGILMTLVNLKYIYPKMSDKIESAKLAIKFLGDKYDSYPAEKYLTQLKEFENGKGTEKELEDLRYQALVIDNPEIKFDKLLVRATWCTWFPANWQGNSVYLRSSGQERHPEFNDEIQELSLKDRSLKEVYKPADKKEATMDFCLNFSGDKFLYSGIDVESNTMQVYEMNIDGTGKHRITPILKAVDNYNGIYLPNGKILFCSTASLNSVPCVEGTDYVGTLFEINKDGTGMRQVCFDQENDWYPWVKENGRVMYHRWEYTDNAHYFTRILLEMNPDGTNNRSIYGSNSFWPNTLFYAKQIPGKPSQFSAIVSGHHGVSRAGELIIFDQAKGDFEATGALRRIPGRGQKIDAKIVDKYMAGKYPRFLHPFPINENFFLVSGQIKPSDRWAVYLVDTFDNVIKLADGLNNKHLFEPVPIMKRKTPPVIPSRIRPEAKDATLYIQDIYAGPGLRGVDRGSVAGIRIFTYGYAYRLNGSHDALAIEGEWDTKRVLGTVPVEKDGSLMVKIPAKMPISIQPIDKNGSAMQLMKSWTAAQPGEVLSCVGCHEPSRMAPLSRRAIASTKPPQKLKPWSKIGRIYGFSFKREIQPILDKYCAGCHDGTDPKLPNFKDCSEVRFNKKANFSKSYMALHPYVRRPGPESDLHLFYPMEFHTSTSELFQKLNKGHHGVKIDDESMRQLATWVDLNVPYHGAWEEVNKSDFTCAIAKRTVEYKKRFSNLDDDIEWMPEMPKTRPKFVAPDPVIRPQAITTSGWPLNIEKSQITEKTVTFGDQKLAFVKVPAGKYVMGSVTGERDEYPETVVTIKKPFLMSTTEITNGQFREFDPKHDSKYIDQQWKDHIFPGYVANNDEQPVIRVSWDEAMAFTKWLGKKLGQKVELPTEAQWEWAARAGSDKPFFFGDKGFENYANLADANIAKFAVSGVDPQPVPASSRYQLNDFIPRDMSFDDGIMVPIGTANYDCNPWGLYDMIGNVAEWTRSAYKPYPYKDDDGRNDITTRDKRVVRGGSWRNRPSSSTASFRLPYQPYQKVYNVGFRVIMEFDNEAELDKAFNQMTTTKDKQPWKLKRAKVKVDLSKAKLESNVNKPGKEGDASVIDNSYRTKLYTSPFKPNSWYSITFNDGQKVSAIAYKIVSGNDCPERDPQDWEFYGSNDGGKTWKLLDTRKGVVFDKRCTPYEFEIKNPEEFSSYKINFSKAKGHGLQFSELELIKYYQ